MNYCAIRIARCDPYCILPQTVETGNCLLCGVSCAQGGGPYEFVEYVPTKLFEDLVNHVWVKVKEDGQQYNGNICRGFVLDVVHETIERIGFHVSHETGEIRDLRPVSPPVPTMAPPTSYQLTKYIIEWLRSRCGAVLEPAIGAMTVADYESMHEELAHILIHCGHPPNWVPR